MPSCDFFGGAKYCSCSDCREHPVTSEPVPKQYDETFVLTRGKMKGKTFKEASKNKNYIQYCKLNAKHEELKALVEFAEKQ